jgi:hypothetical protein
MLEAMGAWWVLFVLLGGYGSRQPAGRQASRDGAAVVRLVSL